VWGTVGDRLIELVAEPAGAFGVVGLPDDRARTTADRVRAAMVNSGLLGEAPSVSVRLDPPVRSGPTWNLDLAVALASLASTGLVGRRVRWILASGRLGLDGAVLAPGLEEQVPLAEVVHRFCHTPLLGSEHVFEQE
jgi:predicted ATPase with chaperone activity